MSSPPRIQFPGAIYHVTSRAVDGACLFLDDRDDESFLLRLSRVVARSRWILHAYCLMTNHYHLLLTTPEPNLARGMQLLNGGYAISFNRRHGRRGHLFERRYSSTPIESERHLLEGARYIVLNPVRAGVATAPADSRWTSYHATAGLAPAPSLLKLDWLLGQFSEERRRAQQRYRAFIDEGAPAASLEGLALLAA